MKHRPKVPIFISGKRCFFLALYSQPDTYEVLNTCANRETSRSLTSCKVVPFLIPNNFWGTILYVTWLNLFVLYPCSYVLAVLHTLQRGTASPSPTSLPALLKFCQSPPSTDYAVLGLQKWFSTFLMP